MIAPTAQPTDEHTWFGEAAASFVERHIWPHREEIRAARRIPRALWLQAGEDGFLGLGVPEDHGGTGTDDFRFNALFQEQLTRAGLAYASAFGIHTDVVAPYLTELTTEEQKERWLPRFCRGEMITAIAMTEPEAGSDLAALRTGATRDGDGWRISGSKTFITNGMHADFVIVAARTGEVRRGRGISLFVVEEGAAGFTRGRKLDKVGQHEADTAELFFDAVPVPGGEPPGRARPGLRPHDGAPPAGAHERRVRQRRPRRVGARGDARLRPRASRVRPADRRLPAQPVPAGRAGDRARGDARLPRPLPRRACREAALAVDAAKAKWWTADVQNRVLDACVQLYGGYGYMEEYDVARAWADARVSKIWAGSNEIMKEVIGRDLGLGDPRPA